MTRKRLTKNIEIDWGHNNPEWRRIRTSPRMTADLEERGKQWTARLNNELRAAQAARHQPIADGYAHTVSTSGTRARLYVWPYTARAIAHEAVNQSMLKLVPIGSVKRTRGPDHEVPRELARRSNEGRGADLQGNVIHRLD
jgi:hypothetical protein